jgi:hypothetical protein
VAKSLAVVLYNLVVAVAIQVKLPPIGLVVVQPHQKPLNF